MKCFGGGIMIGFGGLAPPVHQNCAYDCILLTKVKSLQ